MERPWDQRRLFWFCQTNHDLEQKKDDSPFQSARGRSLVLRNIP